MTSRKIKVPEPKSYSHWPEKPYKWMLTGLIHTIQKAGGVEANYLVALGLVCYTEFMGHEVLKFRNSPSGSGQGKNAFNLFIKEYMDYSELLDKHEEIYDWFRCGLCHEFKIKNVDGGRETGVFHFFVGNSEEVEKVKKLVDADPTKGIAISKQGKRILFIEPYLRDFQKGVEKFLKESNEIT